MDALPQARRLPARAPTDRGRRSMRCTRPAARKPLWAMSRCRGFLIGLCRHRNNDPRREAVSHIRVNAAPCRHKSGSNPATPLPHFINTGDPERMAVQESEPPHPVVQPVSCSGRPWRSRGTSTFTATFPPVARSRTPLR